MLVLSRRVGEAIRIGDDIVVYVTQTKAGRVTLGIEAPRSIGILRGELQKRSGEPAVGTSADPTSPQHPNELTLITP